MKTFVAALAALALMTASVFGQCNAGRQQDTTNLNLGLQAAPVDGGTCANGQCNLQTRTQGFVERPPQAFAYNPPVRYRVEVGAPGVDVRVGVRRAYTPLYVVTDPREITYQRTYAMGAPRTGGSTSASSSAGGSSSSSSSSSSGGSEIVQGEVFAEREVLAFDPSVGVQVVSACSGGSCGGGRLGIFGRRGGARVQLLRAPRTVNRSRSVSVSRTF